jgi:PAS domain-containing protein
VTAQSLWTEWTLKNFRGMIYALGRDITATKNRQSELAQREKQLSEAESIGHMGHWRWQVDSEDITWSEEVFRIFGLDPNHFQPTLKRINDTVHRSDIARMIQAFQRAIIEKKSYDMEFRIARPQRRNPLHLLRGTLREGRGGRSCGSLRYHAGSHRTHRP